MNLSSITVPFSKLADLCVEFVKAGIIFKASPVVNSETDYIIEFTGGF